MALSAVIQGKVDGLTLKDDGFITHTVEEQRKVEEKILHCYVMFNEGCDATKEVKLLRTKHVSYLKHGLERLSESYECLDASRPWLCFWIVHSLELLQEAIPEEVCETVANFLAKCQDCENGGFAGGPGQLPHLAPTYAAVCTLCILGKTWKAAYDLINREKLSNFLHSRHGDDGSFTMHIDGEVDIRGVYCAVVVARLTNVFTKEMFSGTADWLAKCQTYEGGFSGLPGLEAHGGYSFCGFAALALLGQEQKININRLLKWTAFRQMRLEGGFQGRTNKLVDGCYSFWQGALFPILHSILQMYDDVNISQEKWMFNQTALEEYILVNCQQINGGLRDKPSKSRDYYHTCYCLSGLAIAEHFIGDGVSNTSVAGGKKNILMPIHPIFNICIDSAEDALKHYKRLPVPHSVS